MTTAVAATMREAASAMPPAPPLVRFEAVRTGRDGAGARVSFAIAPGALLLVEGAPAEEVDALLRMAALRAAPPTEGVAWLAGRDARGFTRRDAAAWRASIGYVDAAPAAVDHMSVFANAALPRRLAGERAADCAAPVEELLRWVGLWRRAGERADSLSLAGQRRLSLAMALSRGPELLIANRPEAGLDDVGRAALLRLIGEARRAGTAVLIATSADAGTGLQPDAVLRLRDGRADLADAPHGAGA